MQLFRLQETLDVALVSEATRRDIIHWWESRRLRFAVKPSIMLFGPFLYGIAANICYTFGWMVDVTACRGSPRRWLYKLGVIVSLVLTALPGVWAVSVWLFTVYTGRKLGSG